MIFLLNTCTILYQLREQPCTLLYFFWNKRRIMLGINIIQKYYQHYRMQILFTNVVHITIYAFKNIIVICIINDLTIND